MTNIHKLAIFISGLLISGLALAASISSTMDITATVAGSCSVSSTGAAFGPVNAVTGGSTTGTIDVNCESGAAYSIALDAGLHYVNDAEAIRFMENAPGAIIGYVILDTNSGLHWGDSSFANTYPLGDVVTGIGNGAIQQLAFDAALVVSALSTFTADTSYSDTVTITVHF